MIVLTVLLIAMTGSSPACAQELTHRTVIDGKPLRYRAAFWKTLVHDAAGRPAAEITTYGYLASVPAPSRPVLFAFNGGPGSSSAPLHVALLAPERIDLPADPAVPLRDRYPLVPNEETIVPTADVVLIDPPGTGTSRILDPRAAPYLQSVAGDAAVVAEAIRSWLSAHGRTSAPVYILGESYGATRAVEVAGRLGGGVDLKGLVLLSQSLAIVDTVQRRDSIVGQAVGLPTLAASAWYHHRAGGGEPLAGFVARAWDFARRAYLPALDAGTSLPPRERDAVAATLASFTGVPAARWTTDGLLMTKERFRRVLLADRGLVLGLYDTRYTGPASAAGNPDDRLTAPFAPAIAEMLRRQFGIADAPGYVVMAPDAFAHDWTYLPRPLIPTDGATYAQYDYAADLAALMRSAPALRVLVAGGYFDTAASWGADEYLVTRAGLDAERLVSRHYPAGHMFYTDPASRRAFAGELRRFVVLGER